MQELDALVSPFCRYLPLSPLPPPSASPFMSPSLPPSRSSPSLSSPPAPEDGFIPISSPSSCLSGPSSREGSPSPPPLLLSPIPLIDSVANLSQLRAVPAQLPPSSSPRRPLDLVVVEDPAPPARPPPGDPSQLVLASRLDQQTALAREQEEEEFSKELASFIHPGRPQSRPLPAALQLCDWLNDEEVSDSAAVMDLPLLFIEESEEEEERDKGANVVCAEVGLLKQTQPDRLKDPKTIRPDPAPHTEMETQQEAGRTAGPLKRRLPNRAAPWSGGCTGGQHQSEDQRASELQEEEPPSRKDSAYENKVKSTKNTFVPLSDGEYQKRMEQYDERQTDALEKKASFRPLMEKQHLDPWKQSCQKETEIQADQSPSESCSVASAPLYSYSPVPKPALPSPCPAPAPSPAPSPSPAPAPAPSPAPSPAPTPAPSPLWARLRSELRSPRQKPFQREVVVKGKPPRSPVPSRRLCSSPPRGPTHSPAPRVQRQAFPQGGFQCGGEAFTVLYNYHPHNDDELELTEGDTIDVMEQCDDGWFVGTSRRSRYFGTFPGNYVRRL